MTFDELRESHDYKILRKHFQNHKNQEEIQNFFELWFDDPNAVALFALDVGEGDTREAGLIAGGIFTGMGVMIELLKLQTPVPDFPPES